MSFLSLMLGAHVSLCVGGFCNPSHNSVLMSAALPSGPPRCFSLFGSFYSVAAFISSASTRLFPLASGACYRSDDGSYFFPLVSLDHFRQPYSSSASNESNISRSSGKFRFAIYPSEIDVNHDFSLLNNNCNDKVFTIGKDDNVSIHRILFELARDCGFSIEYYDGLPSTGSSPQNLTDFRFVGALFFNKEKLDFILSSILSNSFYEISRNKLKIFRKQLRIFDINYISGTRLAHSSTNVVFSQEQHSSTSGDIDVHRRLNPYPGRAGTDDEMRRDFNRFKDKSRYSGDHFGRSGTKIYSIDEVNFWEDLQSEIYLMLNDDDKLLIDKSAGLIGVWSDKAHMSEVSLFLEKLYRKMIAQVFLDVEIIDLLHSDTSGMGLNWQNLLNLFNPSIVKSGSQSGNYHFNVISQDVPIGSILEFLSTYGEVRHLSNPKISVLNNQPAMISVGSVVRYSLNTTYQSASNTNSIHNTTTTFPSVFAGILLDITPSIDRDGVILRINPSITKLKNENLENSDIALQSPPNLSTNQLSSIVRLQDGDRVVIGGLMSSYSSKQSQKIPFLGSIPLLGYLFTHHVREMRNKELIIIITPYITRYDG